MSRALRHVACTSATASPENLSSMSAAAIDATAGRR
jgi:hypothetical protein